ncbi:MAG: hypothetical protein ACOYT4_00580 [Nanoarchaeota archaeon]
MENSKLIETIEKLENKAKNLEQSKSTGNLQQIARAYFNAGILSERVGLKEKAQLNYANASRYVLELAKDVYAGAFQ